MPQMRVALNATALLSPATGIGHYVRELARELLTREAVDLDCFYGLHWAREIRDAPVPHIGKAKSAIKSLLPGSYYFYRALQQWRFSRGARGERVQVYHDPNFLSFRFDGPTVITVHDLSFLRFPETHPKDRVRILCRQLPKAIERAGRVLADSEFVRGEIIAEYGVAPEKVIVAPLAASPQFRPRSAAECQAALQAQGLTYRGYLLGVGTLEPRKNLVRLVEAYGRLPKATRLAFPLVLAGMPGWLFDATLKSAESLVREGSVRLLGYLPIEQLLSVYSGAMAFAYPSLYEGFGLPPLEAMASGVPVVCSRRASLPEVVGDCGLYCEPEDTVELSALLAQVLEDEALRGRMIAGGLQRAAGFSWARCGDETLRAYREAMAAF